MVKKLAIVIAYLFIVYSTNAQNKPNNEQVSEISQLINYFQGTDASFFQTKRAKDSLIFLLNNKPHQNDGLNQVDIQKVYFNRTLLSLELFFSADQMESYYFDYIYRNVPFLKRIYLLYIDYPSKNFNSLSTQEGVALMYQTELYLFFSKDSLYIKKVKSIIDAIDDNYKKAMSKK